LPIPLLQCVSGGGELTETTIAVLAMSGAALALAWVLVVRALRARTRRRFDVMLDRVDDHIGSISDSLRDALDRSDEIRADAVREHELTWEGLANAHERLGYEAELEREIIRARTTQRPLSLVALDVHDLAGSKGVERVAAELSALLGRVTRTSDRVVRRGDEELVVLLPETTEDGAQGFCGRLRAELKESFDNPSRKLTVSTGVVEWKPDESIRSFDARARRAVGRVNVEPFERRTDAHDLPGAG